MSRKICKRLFARLRESKAGEVCRIHYLVMLPILPGIALAGVGAGILWGLGIGLLVVGGLLVAMDYLMGL